MPDKEEEILGAELDREREKSWILKEEALEDKREVAEEEFKRFTESWEIASDTSIMTEEDADSFRTQKARIIEKIVSNAAVVTESGDIRYTLKKAVGVLKEVTLVIPPWGAWSDMDRGRKDKNMSKFTHFIANAVGQPVIVLTKMHGIDAKFIQGVYSLFLGS